MELLELFHYGFLQRAFFAGTFVAISCSVLGLFLVLRKMSLIGDGLSHVSFGAIALGLFFGFSPIYVSIPLVVASSVIILKISEKARVYGDAAIGIVSAVGIAGGVLFTSLSHGFNVSLLNYLFGNILAISTSEAILSGVLSLVILATIFLFYWDLFSATFDEEYAKTTGIKTNFINMLLTILTAITVVLSIKVVGVMLISALLIFPAITALQISKKFKNALFSACFISFSSVFFGIICSFLLDLPTGAVIVMINAIFFITALLCKKMTS
ncbi:metal ABC transporter permease [Candidatus Peregrinibacteria bacterium]|nr:MAG: metal ABC transporter permease [Candidatus Peregrinibacteria bacterium]